MKIIILFSFLLASCAAFWNKEIKSSKNESVKIKIQNLDLVFTSTLNDSKVTNIGEIYIDKKWTLEGGQSAIWKAESYVDLVLNELKKSNYFQNLQVVYSKSNDNNRYTLVIDRVTFQDKYSNLKESWAYVSVMSFGIIPYWNTKSIKFKITLHKGDKMLKSYDFSEDVNQYISVLLLPISPFYFPIQKETAIVKYIINEAIIKFKDDNLI